METIRIDTDRVKILLTREDLARYGLSVNALDPDSEAVSVALRRLVRDAGFEEAGGRIYLQLYESRSGGCEIFATRLPAEKEEECADATYLLFSCLGESVALAKRLRDSGFRGESRLLRGGDRWFLCFPQGNPPFACDYGETLTEADAVYIEEYADTVLAEEAVERLALL